MIRAIRRRIEPETRDDGAAMLLVIFVVMVLAGLSLMILGSITSRIRPAVAEEKRAMTLAAAEAGLQAGVAAISNSASVDSTDAGNVTGDRNMLPCWSGQGGSVSVSDNTLSYSATITYFLQDPSGQSDAWRNNNKMACTPGYGPTSGAPNYSLPKFALVSSDGIGTRALGATGNRRMEAVYTFRVSNQNIVGGSLGWGTQCFDAGAKPYTAGRAVTLKPCDPSRFSQMWSHRNDFLVQLSESAASGAAGWCLEMDPVTSGSTTSSQIRLQNCDQGKPVQRWGFDDGHVMFARPLAKDDTSPREVWCVANVSGMVAARYQGSSPCPPVAADPKIGAGAAGTTDNNVSDKPLQWVNYKHFGRCYDVTDWILNSSPYNGGRPSEILYPCKQDPLRLIDGNAGPGWNQVLTWNAPTKLFYQNAKVDANGYPSGSSYNRPSDPADPKWCMKSPNRDGNGAYVTFSKACNKDATEFQWVVNRDTGSAVTAYTIVDGFGRCLAAGDRNPSYPSSYDPYFSVVTATCDGSPAQKWNAPPIVSETPLSNVRERIIN